MTHPATIQSNIEDFFQVLGNYTCSYDKECLGSSHKSLFSFRGLVVETTNNFKISLMFKNRSQKWERNPYSYAKGLILNFVQFDDIMSMHIAYII